MMTQPNGSGLFSLSSRREGRFCHSEASVVSTVMMSSTPRDDTAAEIAGLELRRDRVGDDDLGQRIRQRTLKPVPDLDADAVFLRRDEEEDAVVLGFFAKLPGAEQRVGVRFDLLAVERADGRDDKLDAGL